jgi:hypothetical protein
MIGKPGAMRRAFSLSAVIASSAGQGVAGAPRPLMASQRSQWREVDARLLPADIIFEYQPNSRIDPI